MFKGTVNNIKLDNSFIYFTALKGDASSRTNILYKMDLNTNNYEALLLNVGPSFDINNNYIFFENMQNKTIIQGIIEYTGGGLSKMSLTDGKIINLTNSFADNIIVCNNNVFFKEYFDNGDVNGKLSKSININGGEIKALSELRTY